ncbi:hypothetical protein ASPZODRAFT_130368 [Penicilliopsis zonata CBS 506.65]|uniref:Uncharacterized protein n=1 Tax=Penicilliopsis zonata CBS 506.65 TaxID=1073090 RepID=A0A1L9SMM1_9EURO|nr:hypothetical protein ASPZODRAFT_130368 [Penicilliopsis zonata CBS 506.65]OJJ48363.1 hypothetical protein ASPZODRAFT_130368 [Penicilliopsis zonata CBS 506.65]
MFRRRRSSSHHQPLSTASSQSAQSAATHAFLKSQPSTTSLSSAAAAAALRSLTPTPTPVDQVQTKRMQRRSSVSAHPNPAAAGSRPGSARALRRSSSSGSMTSRTFRDQSPRRPATSGGPVEVPPPLPAMPQAFSARKEAPRRSVSMDPSMRMNPAAAIKTRQSGRGVSVDREAKAISAKPPPHRTVPMGTLPEVERSASRNSINFSYPINARNSSPRQSPVLSNYPNPTTATADHEDRASPVNGLSSAEVGFVQESVIQASNRPVRKRSKLLAPGSVEGSHLAATSAGVQPTETAVAAAQAASVNGNGNKRPEPRYDAYTRVASPAGSSDHTDSLPSSPSSQKAQSDPGVRWDPPTRPPFKKRPSTVPEEKEEEQRAEAAETGDESIVHRSGGNVANGLFTGPQQARLAEEHQVSSAASSLQSSPIGERAVGLHSLGESRPISPTVASRMAELHPESSQVPARQSSSPGRSARFANRLSVTGAGDVLHEPPPRSVSPAKSALKHPQKDSLSPDRRPGITVRVGQTPSEISDATSIASDEGSRLGSRKKHAKVSFDDEAEVVGVAASPPTSPEDITPDSSPPGKTKSKAHWFSMGRKKPQGGLDLADGDEFGDVLRPRPALPSFGSIRGATRDLNQVLTEDPMSDDDESIASSTHAETRALPLSSDHAIGGILVNARPAADAVPEHHAPDKLSDTNTTTTTTTVKPFVDVTGVPAVEIEDASPVSWPGDDDRHIPAPTDAETDKIVRSNLPIPIIAVQPASPELEKERSSLELYRVPGGFPRSSTHETLVKATAPNNQPAEKEAPPPEAPLENHTIDIEDDDDSSIYSDAAEDLLDIEGDGFGSINAVVESPEELQPMGLALTTTSAAPPSPPTASVLTRAEPASPVSDERVSPVRAQANARNTNKAPSQSTRLSMVVAPDPPSSKNDTDALPFVSPYPPFPLAGKNNAGEPSRSNGNGKKTKRPMSVDAYGSTTTTTTTTTTRLRDAGPISDGRTNGNMTSRAAPTAAPERRSSQRPVSMGPGLQINGRPNGQPRRTMSNGSDSSSSFKRSPLPPSRAPEKKMSMRRTMRDGSPRVQSPTARPMSPNERKPFSSAVTTGSMRTTMRRGGEKPAASSSSKANNANTSSRLTKASAIRFGSRFDDSDDEGHAPRTFRSRFADSSDDEDDQPSVTRSRHLRPVRGIPRQNGAHDGDSTELEDSSDDDDDDDDDVGKRPAAASASISAPRPGLKRERLSDPSGLAAVARSRGVTREELQDLMRQPSRKSGLLSRFGRSKKPSMSAKNAKSGEEFTPHYVATVTSNMPVESPSSSPRLQKRMSKKPPPPQPKSTPTPTTTSNNSSWPLRGESDRPRTADGAGPRVLSQSPVPWESQVATSDVMITGSGRKKRFPSLRRVFGLR